MSENGRPPEPEEPLSQLWLMPSFLPFVAGITAAVYEHTGNALAFGVTVLVVMGWIGTLVHAAVMVPELGRARRALRIERRRRREMQQMEQMRRTIEGEGESGG